MRNGSLLRRWRAPAALVALAGSPAQVAAEETLLDMWARWIAWLDAHVPGRGTADVVAAEVVKTGGEQ